VTSSISLNSHARIRSLDSLRGLAALIVIFHHMRLVFPETPIWIKLTPLRFFVAGESSVLLFFLLSGFVLFVSLGDESQEPFAPYITKRLCRIYIPFAISILASSALWLAVSPMPLPGASSWLLAAWEDRPTLPIILGHLAMTDDQRYFSLNNVMWSLVIEIRISLIFPFLAYAVQRNWRAACLFAAIFSGLCIYFENMFHPTTWKVDPFNTGRYIVLFVFGAALAYKRNDVRAFVDQLLPWLKLISLVIALGMFSIAPLTAGSVPTSLGALVIMVAAFADGKLSAALSKPALIWLGKISYSLYLIHLPILLTALHLFWGRMPILMIFMLVIPTALAAAGVMYRFVERPAISLGRKLASLTDDRLSMKRPSFNG